MKKKTKKVKYEIPPRGRILKEFTFNKRKYLIVYYKSSGRVYFMVFDKGHKIPRLYQELYY